MIVCFSGINMKVFKKIVSATGKRKINILTARGHYKPIKKFLSDLSNLFFNQIFSVTNGING